MIEAIITGIGFGLVLSVLTGPVFFALIKTSIEKGFHAGVAMALGVVTSDMVFINIKVIQPNTNVVMAGQDYVLAKEAIVRSMLQRN